MLPNEIDPRSSVKSVVTVPDDDDDEQRDVDFEEVDEEELSLIVHQAEDEEIKRKEDEQETRQKVLERKLVSFALDDSDVTEIVNKDGKEYCDEARERQCNSLNFDFVNVETATDYDNEDNGIKPINISDRISSTKPSHPDYNSDHEMNENHDYDMVMRMNNEYDQDGEMNEVEVIETVDRNLTKLSTFDYNSDREMNENDSYDLLLEPGTITRRDYGDDEVEVIDKVERNIAKQSPFDHNSDRDMNENHSHDFLPDLRTVIDQDDGDNEVEVISRPERTNSKRFSPRQNPNNELNQNYNHNSLLDSNTTYDQHNRDAEVELNYSPIKTCSKRSLFGFDDEMKEIQEELPEVSTPKDDMDRSVTLLPVENVNDCKEEDSPEPVAKLGTRTKKRFMIVESDSDSETNTIVVNPLIRQVKNVISRKCGSDDDSQEDVQKDSNLAQESKQASRSPNHQSEFDRLMAEIEKDPVEKSILSTQTLIASENENNGTVELDESDELSQGSTPSKRKTRSKSPRSRVLAIYPPPPAQGAISINIEDYKCLGDGIYLNDVIIDFYLKYLIGEILAPSDKERTHVFSSHFYTRLINPVLTSIDEDEENEKSMGEKRYAGVRRWTKNVNIFEKDFIIFPINRHSHWFLVIVCFPYLVGNYEDGEFSLEENNNRRPCILIFDSLTTDKKVTVVKHLRSYLECEYQTRMNEEKSFLADDFKVICPVIPKQTNATDCGLFVLQYAEQFFKEPITDFSPPIDLGKWFPRSIIVRKRRDIAELIQKLAANCDVGKNNNIPHITLPFESSKSILDDDYEFKIYDVNTTRFKSTKSQIKKSSIYDSPDEADQYHVETTTNSPYTIRRTSKKSNYFDSLDKADRSDFKPARYSDWYPSKSEKSQIETTDCLPPLDKPCRYDSIVFEINRTCFNQSPELKINKKRQISVLKDASNSLEVGSSSARKELANRKRPFVKRSCDTRTRAQKMVGKCLEAKVKDGFDKRVLQNNNVAKRDKQWKDLAPVFEAQSEADKFYSLTRQGTDGISPSISYKSFKIRKKKSSAENSSDHDVYDVPRDTSCSRSKIEERQNPMEYSSDCEEV